MLSAAKHLNLCVLARASPLKLSSTLNVKILRFAQDDHPYPMARLFAAA
jgi:hypothetical protein